MNDSRLGRSGVLTGVQERTEDGVPSLPESSWSCFSAQPGLDTRRAFLGGHLGWTVAIVCSHSTLDSSGSCLGLCHHCTGISCFNKRLQRPSTASGHHMLPSFGLNCPLSASLHPENLVPFCESCPNLHLLSTTLELCSNGELSLCHLLHTLSLLKLPFERWSAAYVEIALQCQQASGKNCCALEWSQLLPGMIYAPPW